jgi:hypothetical protein
MFDANGSGTIDLSEFNQLFEYINTWKGGSLSHTYIALSSPSDIVPFEFSKIRDRSANSSSRLDLKSFLNANSIYVVLNSFSQTQALLRIRQKSRNPNSDWHRRKNELNLHPHGKICRDIIMKWWK